jgi:O-antigen ligase
MNLILASLLLFRLPAIYLTAISSTLLTTYSIAILLVAISFVRFINRVIEKKKSINVNFELILIMLFMVSQTLSIINVISIMQFLQRYYKLVIGIIFFIIIRTEKNRPNLYRISLLKVLLISSLITLTIQFFLVFFSREGIFIFKDIIYHNHLSIIEANLNTNKIHDNSYVEIVIPFLFFALTKQKRSDYRIIIIVLIICFGVLSLISNFRYRFIVYLSAIIGSVFYVIKKQLSTTPIISIIITIILLLQQVLNSNSISTAFNRLLIEDKNRDYSSIVWRLDMFEESLKMARNNYFGVGLGNFFEILPTSQKKLTTLPETRKTIALGALNSGPHNIFFQTMAESGLIGLVTFIVLLGFYFYRDFLRKKIRNSLEKTLIMMFWLLILTIQFFPAINIHYFILFFTLRALV